MSRLHLLWLALVPFLVVHGIAHAQEPFWQPSSGPFGSMTQTIAQAPDHTLYAGTFSGLFRSTDDGDTWSVAIPSLRDSIIPSLLTTADGTVLAFTLSGTVWRSPDGSAWDSIGKTGVGSDAVARTESVIISSGASGSGMSRSIDGGITWTSVTGAVDLSARFLERIGGDSIIAATRVHVLLSTDAGLTWSQRDTTDLEEIAGGIVVDRGTLYALIHRNDYDQSMRRSTDWGISWTEIESGLEGKMLGGISAAGGRLFMSTSSGIARWDADEQRWAIISPLARSGGSGRIMKAASGALFAASEEGVFRSSDDGATWNATSNGMTCVGVWSLAVASNGDLYAGSIQSLYRSTDVGLTWSRTHVPGGAMALATTPTGAVLASLWDGIHRTDDGGETSTRDSLGPEGSEAGVEQIVVAPDGTAYARGSSAGLLRSVDDGRSWHDITGDFESFGIGPIATGPSNELFMCHTARPGIKRSTDRGDTWTQVSDTLGYEYDISHLFALPGGDLLIAQWNGGVVRLDPSTHELRDLGPEFELAGIFAIELGAEGQLYVSSWRAEDVLRGNIETGAPWERLGSGLESPRIRDVAIHPGGYLFAAATGVQRSRQRLSSVRDLIGPVLAVARVSYSDGLLEVRIDVERGGASTITLRDVRGMLALDPVRRELPAGKSRLAIPVDGISSGSYFVEIHIEGRRMQRRIEIVR